MNMISSRLITQEILLVDGEKIEAATSLTRLPQQKVFVYKTSSNNRTTIGDFVYYLHQLGERNIVQAWLGIGAENDFGLTLQQFSHEGNHAQHHVNS